MASGPTHRVSCPSRSRNLVCKIPMSLLGLSETNTIGYQPRAAGGLVVLGRSIHTESSMVVYEPKMAKFLRKEARMTTAVAPLLSVSSRVQLTARQRACLEQIARRQTSPQRLVRRAKILLALETGATQCHVM